MTTPAAELHDTQPGEANMNTKLIRCSLGMGALALGAVACGDAKSGDTTENAFLAGVPEVGALELSITDDAQVESLATEDDAVGAIASDALGSITEHLVAPRETAEALSGPRQAVRELNQALRNFLQPIAALVRNEEPDQVVGNVAQWGPVTRGATEYRLFVKRGLLRRFGWALQARPDGSSEEFSNVAAGGIQVGTVLRRGRGVVGVDLDQLANVDPTVNAQGQLLAAFAHGPAGTALAYGVRDFARGSDTTPVDAAFEGVHLRGGYNRVRLAYHGNLPETATAAEEVVLARVRHRRDEGGRADLLAFGGDVADGKLWVVSECWNAGLESTYRSVRECPGDGIGGARCVEQSVSGDPLTCRGDLAQPEFPPSDPEAPMSDPESPEQELTAPTEMPSGDAPSD
jgi:hypothetical protein